MRRYSEVVLNGHPDKFCDLVADRLIAEVCAIEPEAYAQVEVAVWSDVIFPSGCVATRASLDVPVQEVIRRAGRSIGYTPDNHIHVEQYQVLNHLCFIRQAPRHWTQHVNDQSIVNGFGGYDALTHYLLPEHYACWSFRSALINSIQR